jgi:hypothetical protein
VEGEQPRPQSPQDCLPKSLIFTGTDRDLHGQVRREGGRGSCQGPLASDAATHAQLPPLPSCAQPSDVRRALLHLHHSHARPLRPSSTCYTTDHAHAATTPPDPLMPVVDSSSTPLTSPPPKRREEAAKGELLRKPDLPGCHPHSTSAIPDHARRCWHPTPRLLPLLERSKGAPAPCRLCALPTHMLPHLTTDPPSRT